MSQFFDVTSSERRNLKCATRRAEEGRERGKGGGGGVVVGMKSNRVQEERLRKTKQKKSHSKQYKNWESVHLTIKEYLL